MVRMTFTLDEATVAKLAEAAERKGISRSQALREAIHDYRAKSAPWSPAERQRKLRALEEMMKQPPTRSQREVDREIAEIRRARRSGGRLHPTD
jgi:metal-responsive CopG/Arc/MetJ family transcriptional regulator